MACWLKMALTFFKIYLRERESECMRWGRNRGRGKETSGLSEKPDEPKADP